MLTLSGGEVGPWASVPFRNFPQRVSRAVQCKPEERESEGREETPVSFWEANRLSPNIWGPM